MLPIAPHPRPHNLDTQLHNHLLFPGRKKRKGTELTGFFSWALVKTKWTNEWVRRALRGTYQTLKFLLPAIFSFFNWLHYTLAFFWPVLYGFGVGTVLHRLSFPDSLTFLHYPSTAGLLGTLKVVPLFFWTATFHLTLWWSFSWYSFDSNFLLQ